MTITVSIANQSQWNANPDLEVPLKFKRSHIHPGFLYRINGLVPNEQYKVHLEISQVNNFKYTMQNGVYKPRCVSDHPIPPAQIARIPKHKDVEYVFGRDLGSFVDFSSLFFIKKSPKEYEEGTISLDTVYKFEPCLVVVKKGGVPLRFPQPTQRFVTVSCRKREFVDVDASVGQPPARRSRARAVRVPPAHPPLPVAPSYPMPCYPPAPYYYPYQFHAYPAPYQYPVSYDNFCSYPPQLAYDPPAQLAQPSYQPVTLPIQSPPAILPTAPSPVTSTTPPVVTSPKSGTTPEPEIPLPSEEEVENDEVLRDQIFDFNSFLGRDDFFEKMDRFDEQGPSQ